MDGSQAATAALGERICNPPQAALDTSDKILEWDNDLERYERLAETKVGPLAYVHMQKLMPEEAKPKWELERHVSITIESLRKFYIRIIDEYKNGRLK